MSSCSYWMCWLLLWVATSESFLFATYVVSEYCSKHVGGISVVVWAASRGAYLSKFASLSRIVVISTSGSLRHAVLLKRSWHIRNGHATLRPKLDAVMYGAYQTLFVWLSLIILQGRYSVALWLLTPVTLWVVSNYMHQSTRPCM